MKIKERRKKNQNARHLRALQVTQRQLVGVVGKTWGDLIAANLYETASQVGFATRLLCKVPPSPEELELKKARRDLEMKILKQQARQDEVKLAQAQTALTIVKLKIQEIERIRFNKSLTSPSLNLSRPLS